MHKNRSRCDSSTSTRSATLGVKQQHPLAGDNEDGTLLGEFFAGVLAEHCPVVELKAMRAFVDEHIAQLLDYLRFSRVETGLLINFGAPVLHVKNYLMTDSAA